VGRIRFHGGAWRSLSARLPVVMLSLLAGWAIADRVGWDAPVRARRCSAPRCSGGLRLCARERA
jgi:hypothetical protein